MTLALVTGASRGIGRATALKLAQQGYRVAVNYLKRADEAQQVVAQIREQGGEAFAVQADIAEEAQVMALFQRLDEEAMPLGVLVNNAGILFTQCRVEDLSADRLQRVFATNVTGAFLCCREAVKRMGTQHGGLGGSIINVSSAASRLGAPGEYVDYAASKGAMDSLTKGLSLEVAAQGIRVNSVRPGFIYTEMHADGGEPGRVDRVAATACGIPMGRGGEAEEIAEAIAWLASEAASYITGTFIDAAGGR
ncbi:SDR family oxidoreductase [Pantoea septica]|uniref:SDR family oxidoreductase n=1 Tax=Pantoea septica TaxID=472695 RepID=UPI00289F3180|nr:SDR family oxidoreductase [Pantoea septica]